MLNRDDGPVTLWLRSFAQIGSVSHRVTANSTGMTLDRELFDVSWVLLCAALVMLMQAGFSCLETGMSRAKSSINVAIKNLIDFCIAGPLFWLAGYGLMFGTSWCGIVGTDSFALSAESSPKLLAFVLFQLVFCGTSTTIISGAVAERISFASYLVISVFVSLFLYPVFGHWAWAGLQNEQATGWLAKLGFIDFAGSTVVHSLGGWFSLVSVLFLGPRIGRFGKNARPMHGHDLPLAVLGVMLLWFGWFGFNGGSTLVLSPKIPLILLNTNLSAAVGGMAALLLAWVIEKRPSVGFAMNGVLAGLVGVTASCHIVSPWAALLIGITSGMLSVGATYLLEALHIDDVVGAIPVHGACGTWGTLCVALFADPSNFSLGMGRGEQLIVQGVGAAACVAWAFGVGFPALWLINKVVPLRVSAQAEQQGLNVSEHGASTELVDLLTDMVAHSQNAEFAKPVAVEPNTEVGQIAAEYNHVLKRVHQEIAERERAADALRRAEEKYRSIFENAVEGIFQTTPDGRYLSVNPALVRIYGYESADELMQSVNDIHIQLYADAGRREEFVRLIEQSDLVRDFQSEVRRKDGSKVWISENARVIRNEQGQTLYYEGTVEDITERRKLLEWQAQTAAADASNRAKSTFLAKMSHEIRTPLNGVIGMLELLAGTGLAQKQDRYVRIAKSSADSLLSLINDILDFTKIEAGKLELEQTDFHLPSLLEDITEMFGHRAESKGLELSCHVLCDVPLVVAGDPERVRQVIVNMLGNALKFTERGSISIKSNLVETTPDHTTVRIAIRDTGMGIPLDRQHRLFEAFQQADASITRKFGGTGLGLSICKQLIELMGGKVAVESREGEGSTFSMTIPFKRAVNPAPRPVDLPSDLQGLRVLAVDDHDTNLDILRDQLTSWGFRLSTLKNPLEVIPALRVAQRDGDVFHLVILDQQMPEQDGLDLAKDISRELWNAAPKMLMLTSLDNELSREQMSDLGLDGYMTKPIRQSRLFDTIVDVLHAAKAPQVPIETICRPVQAVTTTGLRILVAEDNEINQIVTSEMLLAAGHSCDLVFNGREAIEALKQRTYDVVLMDCQMPEMDGFAATTALRYMQTEGQLANQNRLPIIALTANAISGDRELCLAAGMDEYVTKPVNPESLFQAIRMVLSTAAAQVPSSPQPVEEPIATAAITPKVAAVTQVMKSVGVAQEEAVTTEQTINLETLRHRCLHKEELVQRVLSKFHNRLPTDIATLSDAFDQQKWSEVASLVHALKGAAGNVSAEEVRRCATELEGAATTHDQAQCRSFLDRLITAAERFGREVRELMLEHAGQDLTHVTQPLSH